LVELKEKESDPESFSDSDMDKGNHIINVELIATISTTNVQPDKSEEIEEGEHLFHSHMWVKGNPLHYIVENGSQNNMILTNVIKRLKLLRMEYLQPYTIGCFSRDDTLASTSSVTYPTVSIPSNIIYYVMFPHLKFVMLF
jgi:hypothetical protein